MAANIGGEEMKKIIFWITLLLIIFFINFKIFEKEKLIKSGKTVLLKLMPVDPRSLMQGDYMRLRYNVVNKLRISAKNNFSKNNGRIVVAIDTNNVASFIKIYSGGKLKPDEHLLFFKKRGSRFTIGAETFMFQEGSAGLFSKAKYGELKVDADGKCILVGLCNKNFKHITTEKTFSK